MVHDLLMGDSTAQQQVKEPQRLMRDPGDVEQLVREHGEITPYIDPVLSSSRRHYVAFCRRMLKIGLCRRASGWRRSWAFSLFGKQRGA